MKARLAFLILLCLFLLALSTDQHALGFEADYLPLGKEILSRRIAQRLVQDGITNADGAVSFASKSVRVNSDNSVSVFGSDRAGKPWTLVADAPAGAVSAWSGDFDKNGTEDLVLFVPSGAGDWQPNAKVILLMFESSGRPIPWCVDGFFTVDKYGLKELVDLDDDRKAEMVHQTRSGPYWITSVFTSQNSRWRALQSLAGQTLPFQTQFTSKANHSIRNSSNSISSLSNTSGLSLDAVDWCKEDPCSSVLVASKGHRMRVNSVLSHTTVVVLDEWRGRRIAIGSTRFSRRLLEEMSFRRLQVALSSEERNRKRTTSLVFARTSSVGDRG